MLVLLLSKQMSPSQSPAAPSTKAARELWFGFAECFVSRDNHIQ